MSGGSCRAGRAAVLRRIAGFFVEPIAAGESDRPPADDVAAAPVFPSRAPGSSPSRPGVAASFAPPVVLAAAGVAPAPEAPAMPVGTGSPEVLPARAAPVSAAVTGAPESVVAVAAACAGELRARERSAAAVVCIWRPAGRTPRVAESGAGADVGGSPAGATTPGARRLADRLAGHGLAATACGRLAWVDLDRDPEAAVVDVARCGVLADAPWVLGVAGPRPEAFEPLLAGVDLGVGVLPADADPALRALVGATATGRRHIVVAPLASGPARWAALAGLARLRALPEPHL